MITNVQIPQATNTVILQAGTQNISSVQIFLCNTNISIDNTIDIYIVPSGQSQSNSQNLILKSFVIPQGDTLEFAIERIILSQGDSIVQRQSQIGIISTISYMEL